MNHPDPSTVTLNESLSALALIAMRDTEADGFAYFRRSKTGNLVRSQEFGTFITETAISGEGSQTAVSFPLRLHGVVDGILVFAFPEGKSLHSPQPRLKMLVSTIEKVWAAQSISRTYRATLERIISLETELVDSKIANRAQGVLISQPDQEAVEAIVRHVDSVLRPSETLRTLCKIVEELQEEAEERDWAQRAKSILRDIHGMSEAEAHSYLRKSSRQSRRPFVDVARQVVEGTVEASSRPIDESLRGSHGPTGHNPT